MSREQRTEDNWALLFAQELAINQNVGLAVVFTLLPSYPNASLRAYDFMLSGLKEVGQNLKRNNIPFFIIPTDSPTSSLFEFMQANNVATIVSDFDPLRIKQQWIKEINLLDDISHYEVDAHNIVPCKFVSNKMEYNAYNLRRKIDLHIADFLTDFPKIKTHSANNFSHKDIDWTEITHKINVDKSIPPVTNITSGETAALTVLDEFINKKLNQYSTFKDNPTVDAQSNLSAYLHFGQIAAQRIALKIQDSECNIDSKMAFLEQLIVRKELADNFCYNNPNYDNTQGFPEWAKREIEAHKGDDRPYTYTYEELKNAATHDDLWNAAQVELIEKGKMHGYMRMYWAKKILEWSNNTEDALSRAIKLNDLYSLDGRDPNGYTGIAWSIGGVHDRPWFTKPIFGKIRYMNYNGCKSKFNIQKYIDNNKKP